MRKPSITSTFKIGFSQEDLYALRLCYFKYNQQIAEVDYNDELKTLFSQYCIAHNKSKRMISHTVYQLEELLIVLGDIVFQEEHKHLQTLYYRLVKILQKQQIERATPIHF